VKERWNRGEGPRDEPEVGTLRGRYLGTLYVRPEKGDEVNANEELLKGGFALPYDGKGPKPV